MAGASLQANGGFLMKMPDCPSWGWVIIFGGATSIHICTEADITSWAQILKVVSAARLKTSAVVIFAVYLRTQCLKHNCTEKDGNPIENSALFMPFCLPILKPSMAGLLDGRSVTF